MNKLLYRVGLFAYRFKWAVLLIWLAVLVTLGFVAKMNYLEPTSTVSIPGTPAQIALDKLGKDFPEIGQSSGTVVFKATNGSVITDSSERVRGVIQKLQAVSGVKQVIDPLSNENFVSKNGDAAYTVINLDKPMTSIAPETRADIAKIVRDAKSDKLSVYMGGDIIDKMPGDIIGVGEITGVILALIVLIVTFSTIVAAGLPIIVALITVATGLLGLFSLSHVIEISSTTPVLAIMLGLAVGIDYSLFIINKHRHYLLSGLSVEMAAASSISSAGSAVVFAATTVIIALASLSILNIPFITAMGLTAAATVAVAALSAITITPSLFALFKYRLLSKKSSKSARAAHAEGGHDSHTVPKSALSHKVISFIISHPIVITAIAIIIIGAIAWPAKDLQLGLPSDEHAAAATSERKAYDIIKHDFGAGYNSPILVLVNNVPSVTKNQAELINQQVEQKYKQNVFNQVSSTAQKIMDESGKPTTQEQASALQDKLTALHGKYVKQIESADPVLARQKALAVKMAVISDIAVEINNLDQVKSASPMTINDKHQGLIQVISKSAPSSKATQNLIDKLRSSNLLSNYKNISISVTGSAAIEKDINDKLSAALPVYLSIVIGLSLVLLILVFKSILVPVKATLGFLLSVLAMFGAIVAVYQWGWLGLAAEPGPIVSFVPIISIGILFGLAMDYEFFLVSSIHEEYILTKNNNRALIRGYTISSRVVVAAAFIMVSVFGGFITNGDTIVESIGLGLAVGIFVDAFIVRLLITPAIIYLLGKSAWWLPKGLAKILPDVSIEGK